HRRRSDPGRAAPGGADPMIPGHIMRELRYIELFTAKRIRNLRVGPYTSPQRGPGFDFDEHQPYRHGDAVRAPYARRTRAERDDRHGRLPLDGARRRPSIEEGADDVHHRLAAVFGGVGPDQHGISCVLGSRARVPAAAADARGGVECAGAVLGVVAPPRPYRAAAGGAAPVDDAEADERRV